MSTHRATADVSLPSLKGRTIVGTGLSLAVHAGLLAAMAFFMP